MEEIFRKKSIEQLAAPDDLTGYLRVTGPGVWMVLGGIIVLLTGLLAWGVFGNIMSTVTAPVFISEGELRCYVLAEDLDQADEEIGIQIGDVNVTAKTADADFLTLDASDDPVLYRSGYLSPGKNAAVLKAETDLKEGFYDAVVTTEKLKPISLLMSKN